MPPCPPSLGLGLGLPFVRGGGAVPVISVITGTPYPGETLASTIAGQWFADDVAIVGETGSTYVVRLQDAGKDIRCGTSNELFVDYDLDAALWLLDVQTAGGNVTQPRINAADVFYKAEKTSGRYVNNLRLLHLPIWGLAAANAICLKTRASGTFQGGVTHGVGFVTGDGTSGQFDTNRTPASIGQNQNNFWNGYLQTSVKVSSNQAFWGNSFAYRARRFASSDTIRFDPPSISWQGQNGQGIISFYVSSNSASIARRSGASAQVVASGAYSNDLALPTDNMRFMSLGDAEYSNASYGAYWSGISATQSLDEGFTANLKTLWEACTGLSLPN